VINLAADEPTPGEEETSAGHGTADLEPDDHEVRD
jgi:hypothetical protein